MRKGGFKMYMTTEKKNMSLYRDFSPKFPKHQDTEMEIYIGHKVGRDISNDMKSMVRCISAMVVHGFSTKEE